MSDQNQWPKPGETNPGGDASAQQPPAQPESGQPQQYGASAPEAPSAAPTDPWAQSGQGSAAQGVSEGHTAPQNPYSAPQNPYSAPQNPYAAPGQSGYGAPQNPYAAPQAPNGNPYGAPQGANGNPYAAPAGSNPYAAPQNPYAAPGGYASAGYQPYAQRPKTNVLAILSIIFAFGGIIIWPLIILTSPAGAIMGHIALGKIKQTGEGGRGLALAGVIGGWVMTGLFILGLVFFFVLIGIAGHNDYNYDSGYGSGAFIG